ncbi:MAG: hypothetical protein HY714_02310 [Candidatus Omnitrophica bacterium]|nr:hypothetical protein [Candidatus Omnitrophota bacterium]
MTESTPPREELAHLCRYYNQAAHDFFSELQGELEERLGLLLKTVEENAGSPAQLRELVGLLVQSQDALKKRVEDLDFLTNKMLQALFTSGKP